jgi:2-oxoglutarate dehydrogenase E2 component (dihydrolipoamide succinyltransferase)
VDLGERPEQRVPMSRLRARVAERLLQSQHQCHPDHLQRSQHGAGHGHAQAFPGPFEKEHGVKLGFMSFFVKAAVHALKKFPVLNASVDGNDIVYHGYFDVALPWALRGVWWCRSCATPTR